MGFWDWLNGKKTVIGASFVFLIDALTFVGAGLEPVLADWGVDPAVIGSISVVFAKGVLYFGVAHKLWKKFWETAWLD